MKTKILLALALLASQAQGAWTLLYPTELTTGAINPATDVMLVEVSPYTAGTTRHAFIGSILDSFNYATMGSGILPVANGGTGAASLAGLIALGTDVTGELAEENGGWGQDVGTLSDGMVIIDTGSPTVAATVSQVLAALGITGTPGAGKYLEVLSGSSWQLSAPSGGALGTDLSSATDDITSATDIITLAGASENVKVTFTANTVTFTSTTGVVTIDLTDFTLLMGDLDVNTLTTDVLSILDSVDQSHGLSVTAESNLTATRELQVTTGDANVPVNLTDPGADTLFGWDDTAGTWEPVTVGTNLTYDGTTLDALGGGGGGLSDYAELSAEGNATATTFGGASTDWTNKAQILIFDTNGDSSASVPDHTNDHITVASTAAYMLGAAVSFSGGISDTYSFAFFINNGATQVSPRFTRKLGTGGDVGAAALVTIVELTANDTVELWAQNENDTSDLIVEDITITAASKSASLGLFTESHAASHTLSADECYGGVYYVTAGSVDLELPAVTGTGMSLTVISLTANAVNISPNSADLINLDGLALDDSDPIASPGALGDIAVLTENSDGNGWVAITNSWTDAGP